MSTSTKTPSTLFPKIPEIGGFLVAYRTLRNNVQGTPSIVNLKGTVKLHGTHADMVIHSDGTVFIQSRNRIITPGVNLDNHDCAKTLLPLLPEILALRDQFEARYKELNKGQAASRKDPMIIAGEWIGGNIQPGVALSQLETKIFVIVACKINNMWIPIEKYGHIHNEAKGIYNISRSLSFFGVLDIRKPEEAKKKIMEYTLMVEKECPFGKTFGKIGTGEGIVWKPEHPLGADPKFWFKSKGEKHRVSNTENLPMDKKARTADAKTKAKAFAEAAVTENRLKQGLDYLREMGIEKKEDAEEQFLNWLYKDVTVEEKISLKERAIDYNFLKVSIREIGQAWYKKSLGL